MQMCFLFFFFKLWQYCSGQGLCEIFFTFLWHLRPLRVGEFILAHPNPPLHAWRNGLARVGIKRGEATQPRKRDTFKTKKKKRFPYRQIFLVAFIGLHIKYSQDVHDDTKRPHVTWLVIVLYAQNLRSLSMAKHKHVDTDRKLDMKMGAKNCFSKLFFLFKKRTKNLENS